MTANQGHCSSACVDNFTIVWKMAAKKSCRFVKCEFVDNYDNLSLHDVLCPICRSILIEPVSLPCNHKFCLQCLEDIVANSNLTCPLCRVRFGSWHRISKRKNNVVNGELWSAIKKTFPMQVKNKLEGKEEDVREGVL